MASNKETQTTENIEINQLLKDSLQVTANALQKHQDDYALELVGSGVVHSYKATLAQVLTIIIENSFVHSNCQPLLISCVIKQLSDGIDITYFDNGQGIEPGTEKRIFEPFYTSLRTQGHSGLGLHIAYNNITQDLSGNIECHISEKQRLTYHITIPNLSTANTK